MSVLDKLPAVRSPLSLTSRPDALFKRDVSLPYAGVDFATDQRAPSWFRTHIQQGGLIVARLFASRGILRLVAFFVAFILIAQVVSQLLDLGLRRLKTSQFGVSNQILSGEVNAEILISGSSRAVSQYDSRIVQQATGLRTFNIGRNGSQTDMQLAVLKAYLKHNAKPRLLIHNLDSYSFVTTREVYDPGQYLPYLNEADIYQALRKFDPGIWKAKNIPLYGYTVDDMRFTWLLGIRGLVGLQPVQDFFQGYRPGYLHWRGDFANFKVQHQEGVRFEIEAQGARDLEELIAVCRHQGIPVLLVYSPVYYEMQALELNRTEIFARFEEMSRRWQVPLWDYSEAPICRTRDMFYNSQHLNQEGAAVFSTELAGRLAAERPWLEADKSGRERTTGSLTNGTLGNNLWRGVQQ